MTVWEIVIIMVVGSICITGGIGFVYQSIVNTVERYQIRRTKRIVEAYAKVIDQVPGMFRKLIEMVEEENKKKKEKPTSFAKKMRDMEFEDE